MSVNSKMTAIADAIRAKTEGTGLLTLDAMAQDLNVPHIVNVSKDTVTVDTLAAGVTAHDKAGNAITGTMVGGTVQGDIHFNIDDEQLTLNKIRIAGPGASVSISGGNLTVIDCVFDASYLLMSGGTTTFVGCTFLNESSMYQRYGNIIMTDCVFTDCEVSFDNHFEDGRIILTSTNCHFNNCSLRYIDEAYAALVAGGNYINGVLIT